MLQELLEQRMIAAPISQVINTRHEEIQALDLVKELMSLEPYFSRTGDRVTEIAGKLIEHRCAEQEILDVLLLLREHLGDQVSRHKLTTVCSQPCEELLRLRIRLDGKNRQPQTGGPPFTAQRGFSGDHPAGLRA